MKTGIEGIKWYPSPTNCQATSSLLAAIPCSYSLLSLAIPCYPLHQSLATIPCNYPLQQSLASIPCNYPLQQSLAAIPCSYPSLTACIGAHTTCCLIVRQGFLSQATVSHQAFSKLAHLVFFPPLNVWNHTAMWPRFHQCSILWSSCSFVSLCNLGNVAFLFLLCKGLPCG